MVRRVFLSFIVALLTAIGLCLPISLLTSSSGWIRRPGPDPRLPGSVPRRPRREAPRGRDPDDGIPAPDATASSGTGTSPTHPTRMCGTCPDIRVSLDGHSEPFTLFVEQGKALPRRKDQVPADRYVDSGTHEYVISYTIDGVLSEPSAVPATARATASWGNRDKSRFRWRSSPTAGPCRSRSRASPSHWHR